MAEFENCEVQSVAYDEPIAFKNHKATWFKNKTTAVPASKIQIADKTVLSVDLDNGWEIGRVEYDFMFPDSMDVTFRRTHKMATLEEVLEFIDNCDEDQWQEFDACMNARGWCLEHHTMEEFMQGQDLGNPEDGSL